MTQAKHWSECATEAEEAKWWDDHPEYVAELLRRSQSAGKLTRRGKASWFGIQRPRVGPPAAPRSVLPARMWRAPRNSRHAGGYPTRHTRECFCTTPWDASGRETAASLGGESYNSSCHAIMQMEGTKWPAK